MPAAKKKPNKRLPRVKVGTDIKRAKAAQLRVDGKTYAEIAKEVGVTVGRAHQLVKEAHRAALRVMEYDIQEEILLDLNRTDKVITGLMQAFAPLEPDLDEDGNELPVPMDKMIMAMSSRPQNAQALFKALDHRAKLLGLYAKDRAEAGGPNGTSYDHHEIEREIDQLIRGEAERLFSDWIEGRGRPPAIEGEAEEA